MTHVRELLQQCQQALAPHTSTPRVEAEWLVTAALGVSRASLIAYPDRPVSPEIVAQVQQWVAARQRGEPLAYVLGSQPFWTLSLQVTPDTLIPRPETECLVAWILATFPAELSLRVADLGVGSGAIALALAVERPHWHIDATDCAAATLAVAQANATHLGVRQVQFYLGDWCAALPLGQRYALVVSNPPYIDPEDVHLPALRYEPQRALVSANNGMADLQKIIQQSRARLLPGGVLIVEHGSTQAPAVMAAMTDAGYASITSHTDLEQRPRFVTALWQGE